MMKRRTLLLGALAVPTAASANWFTDIVDAVTGHTEDVVDRITTEDSFAPGFVESSNNFRENDRGQDAAHWVSGTAQILRDHDGGKSYVQLQSNFKSGLAPDLYIYVSTENAWIQDEADFTRYEQIELGKLTKGSGASFYELPSTTRAQDVQSITIWCKRFNRFMGSTDV